MAAWAPKNRPVFDSPEKPVAPLSTLLPTREEPRDPQEAVCCGVQHHDHRLGLGSRALGFAYESAGRPSDGG